MKSRLLGWGLFLLMTVPNVFAAQDVLLVSAARTATTNTADIVRTSETGIHVLIKVTAVPGADTITPKIQGKDFQGTYYDLLIGAPISTTGTTVLKVGPDIGAVTNGSAADIIPDIYRVVITHSAGTSFTYAVTINKTGNL